ncbi:MAG: sodium/glutamate symporter [Candidatus Fimivivens sp.]
MTVTDLLIDFAIASLFILIGQYIRSHVGFVQKFFMPASMVAGILALALRYTGLLPFSDSIGSYAGTLIIIIFSAVGINGFTISRDKISSEIGRVGSYFCYKTLAQTIQFSLPVLFSICVISKLFPQINYGFGLLLAAGFSGGHGTAAAVGSAFADLGYTDAMDIGMTCATVGLLAGIFGGLFFIKWATHRGYTKYIKSFSYISGDLKTGLVAKENQQSIGLETISPTTLDPMAWHLAILLVASGAGKLLNNWIYATTKLDLPTYLIAFLIAIAMFLVFCKTGVNDYIDNNIINRISGTATDYLVFFGIASIKIEVVVKYAVPLLMLLVFGIAIVFLTLLYFGPAMNRKSWFERSIFVFGYSTGVFAIGFILLRIVDPLNRSKTLNDTALVAPFNTPIEMFAWSMGPLMLMRGEHWLFIGIYLAATAACIILCHIFRWWWRKEPLNRPAEGEN